MMFMSAYIPCSSPTISQQHSQKLLGSSGQHHKLLSPMFPFGVYGAGDLIPHPLMMPDMLYPLPLLPPGLHPPPASHVTTTNESSSKDGGQTKQDPEKLNFGIDKILEKSKEKTSSDKDTKVLKRSSSTHSQPEVLPPTILPPPPLLPFSLSHVHPALTHPYSFTGQPHSLHSVFEAPHHEPSSSRSQCTPKRKRSWSRAVFSALQRKGLEKRFEVQKYVTKPDRRQLAAVLGLTDAQVKVWFQNRRMKWRHTEEQRKKQHLVQSRQTQQSKSGEKQERKEGQTEQRMTEVHVHVTDSELESDTECL